jgi:hypothetical protein
VIPEPGTGTVVVIGLADGNYAAAKRVDLDYEDGEMHGWQFTGSLNTHTWAHILGAGRLASVFKPGEWR